MIFARDQKGSSLFISFAFFFFSSAVALIKNVRGHLGCRAFQQNQPRCIYYDGSAKAGPGKKRDEAPIRLMFIVDGSSLGTLLSTSVGATVRRQIRIW